jgi:hypothetical protein
MNDFDRLYVLIIQYGLSKDCEYEEKIKHLQGLICRQKVNLQDLLQYIMLRAERTAFNNCYADILNFIIPYVKNERW